MSRPAVGNIPVDTTSFVGRSRELSEASRQRLNIAAEALMDVPPLSEGVALFVERAKAVRADFRQGNAERAAELEGESLRLNRGLDDRMGIVLNLDEVVALAVAGEPRSTTRSASGGPALLTRRESQVAELIARGMTNKEIAAELANAVRTAESHVEHIFAKLGVTSRAQVTTWVIEHARVSED